jgi:hypothetical protein
LQGEDCAVVDERLVAQAFEYQTGEILRGDFIEIPESAQALGGLSDLEELRDCPDIRR